MVDSTIIYAVVSGAVGALLTAVVNRALMKAKVKNIIAQTYDNLINTLSGQVDILKKDVDRLQVKVDQMLVKEIQYLQQITELMKERTNLQIQIMEKDQIIDALKKKYLEIDK